LSFPYNFRLQHFQFALVMLKMNPRYKVVQTELFDQAPDKVNRFNDRFIHESENSKVQNLVVNQSELSLTQIQKYCYNFEYFRENSFLQRPLSSSFCPRRILLSSLLLLLL
jgi:hypothetical protein